MTAPTRTSGPSIAGTVEVDLRGLNALTSSDAAREMRNRLAVLTFAPDGAHVDVRVGTTRPLPFIFDGPLSHLGRIRVLGDPEQVDRWAALFHCAKTMPDPSQLRFDRDLW